MKHGVGPGYNIELVVRRDDKEAIQKLVRDKLKGQKILLYMYVVCDAGIMGGMLYR